MDRSLEFGRLLGELPAGDSTEIFDQTRAVLRHLISSILAERQTPKAEPVDPSCCPNCDCPIELTRSPYCCTECKEMSGFVRQFRAGIVEGSLFDAERQVAFGQNLWFMMGGGRPFRQSLVPEKSRQQVFARAGGKCELCGAEATAIDHIATACNRTINLRAVCAGCSKTKAYSDLSVVAGSVSLLSELGERIATDEAIRCCDDHVAWDWRAYLELRVGAR